jgi:CRISPR-associated protein Cmr6
MAIPLYKNANTPEKRDEQGNAGLWFERFFNQYDEKWQVGDTAKSDFLKQLSGDNNKGACGNDKQLKQFATRHNAMVDKQQGQWGVFENDWHWISGMGNNHPVENGVLWHTVLGVPYLAGSGVKGLVRAWMELQETPDYDLIHQWFGSDHKDPAQQNKPIQAGQVIFHDATPYKRVNLILDVMTPHTGKWLSEGGLDNVPGDWHDPIPVFFLSCKKIVLNFSLSKMPHADSNLDLKQVWKALSDALDFLGSGAKTGTGYGFMFEDKKVKQDMQDKLAELAKEHAKLSLSPEDLIMDKLQSRLNQGEHGGASGIFAADLAKCIEGAIHWNDLDRANMFNLTTAIYTHLDINFKKKGKAKDRLNTLTSLL